MALHVVLCVHLVATLPKLPTPRKAIKASEEEHEQGCSSDKITKQNNLLLEISVPNSAWGNKSGAIVVFTVLKIWRQKCLGELKGINHCGFWHKMNKKDTSWGSLWNTPVTYSHLSDGQFEGDFVWLEISCAYLLVIFRRGFIGTILLKSRLKNNAKTPSHSLLFQPSSFHLCFEKFLLQSSLSFISLILSSTGSVSHSLFPNSLIPAHKALDPSFYHSGPEKPYFQLIICLCFYK